MVMIREAFEERATNSRLHVVDDGVEALAFLRRADGYDDAPRRGRILVDLRMSRKDGREGLAAVTADPVTGRDLGGRVADPRRPGGCAQQLFVARLLPHTKPISLGEFVAAFGKVGEFLAAAFRLPA
ncbi:two-component system response regulator [Actinokineospora sp. NBRC 105648]|nr:two-component system response regulator [Actinokineospora sp. NBRC 105648]